VVSLSVDGVHPERDGDTKHGDSADLPAEAVGIGTRGARAGRATGTRHIAFDTVSGAAQAHGLGYGPTLETVAGIELFGGTVGRRLER
jgi:hypothetical protein